DVAALARAGAPRWRTLQSMLGIPRDAPPPPDAQVTLPPVSERPPPHVVSQPPASVADTEEDEPELTVSHVGSGELDDDDLDDDAPSEPPIALTSTRSEASRAASSRPGTSQGGGSYSVRDAAVDVIAPRKRTSIPPVASERPRSAHSSRPDPRAEPTSDTPVTREVISVPAIDARRRDEPENAPGRLRPAPPSSEEMPSVIVDMGDSVNALVVDLTHCGPEDEGAIVDAIVRTGEIALPTLAQAFPGPPWFDRRRPYRRLPRGRDVSAIARALVAFRERAVPYVESLLDAGQVDRRFYATLVAGELLHPGLVAALAERIFDDDDGTRAAALELLPRFRVFPTEWSESIAQVRRAAKIRGRDLKKRHRAARALGAVRDPGALRLLVELLDDEDAELAEIAHRSLVEITCEDMGTAGRRWTPWLQKHEKQHRIEWLIDALSHSDEAIRTGAGEELKVLTQQYYGYHAASPRKEREVVQQKYRRWWDEEGARLFTG
ncbi:MAG: HEAT repeat domain-containing protein, partial [Myxococcota bacterium]|nr:HEAT repeat domain-containing protein [Myxococcota bacterium]